ncbi:hypothetical protein ACEUEG_20865, partial [Aeromonas media]|uniref:hypothetical protein n=1 Tax=Aeromonas media TaxID=651 RepID=UPI0038CFD869
KRGGWSKKADFGVNTSEFWSNENFKREQAAYDEGAINLFAPSITYQGSSLPAYVLPCPDTPHRPA